MSVLNNKVKAIRFFFVLGIVLLATILLGYSTDVQGVLANNVQISSFPQIAVPTMYNGLLRIVYGGSLQKIDVIRCSAGDRFSLRVVFNPDIKGGIPLFETWHSSDDRVFIIEKQTGFVSAINYGEAICTVSDGSETTECRIIVEEDCSPYNLSKCVAKDDENSISINNAVYMNMNGVELQNATGAKDRDIELIHWYLAYGANITSYDKVCISNNPIITTGMHTDWVAFDLYSNDSDTFVLILKKPIICDSHEYGYDFTAVLDTEGRLLAGMIDDTITPMLFCANEDGSSDYIYDIKPQPVPTVGFRKNRKQ